MNHSADEFSFILAIIGKAVTDTLESEGHLAMPQLIEALNQMEQRTTDDAIRDACQQAARLISLKYH